MKVGIYILNYNGRELLETCLPSIIEAVNKSRYDCNMVVVDNISVDSSRELVESNFSNVEFRVMPENRVLCSFNDVVKDSDEDIVLLLNNDLKIEPEAIDRLVEGFEEKEDAFAVVPCCYSYDGSKIEVSRTLPVIRCGLLKGVPDPDGQNIKNLAYTLQGGFAAFSREKFLEIGGYDDLYLPGIIDDTDLCIRAWKKGYACYYQPKSIFYHMGRASFKKAFGLRRLLAISHRNTYFFSWKNMDSFWDLVVSVLCVPVRMIYAAVTLKPEIIWGFFWTFPYILTVAKKRHNENKQGYVLRFRGAIEKIMKRTWSDMYGRDMSQEEIEENIDNHKEFLNIVMSGNPSKLVEVGAGSGVMAAYFSERVDEVVSVDNDKEVLEYAEKNCKRLSGAAKFKEEDAFNMSFDDNSFDVAFSQGFFEHFSDDDIRRLLKEQLRVAKAVVFSVPTAYYRNRDFGNERLLSVGKWRDILKDFNVADDREYLYLRRKKNFLIKLPMMYMAVIKK